MEYRCTRGHEAEFGFEDIFSVHPATHGIGFAEYRVRCNKCFTEQRVAVDQDTHAGLLIWRTEHLEA